MVIISIYQWKNPATAQFKFTDTDKENVNKKNTAWLIFNHMDKKKRLCSNILTI